MRPQIIKLTNRIYLDHKMDTTQKPPRIVLVDSLRGFALAGVALVHLTQRYITFNAPEGFMKGVDSLPDYIANGIVNLFFV